MHEIGLVNDIIDAIKSKLKDSKEASSIKKITIVIGELEHVTPEHFEFHFREHTKGTSFENAELSFRKAEARFKCKTCGCEYEAGEGELKCPRCGSKLSDVISGSGVFVESVEV
jgi:hydrogenase nickel incorporation protein HypA/HybF